MEELSFLAQDRIYSISEMPPLPLILTCAAVVAHGTPLINFKDFGENELKDSTQWINLDTAKYHDFQPQQMTLEDVDQSRLIYVPDHIKALIPQPVMLKLGIQDGSPLCVIRNLFYADICCGKGRIAKWFMFFGMNGIPIDNINGSQFDLTTLAGLALAIIVVLRVVERGFIMFAPKCSWFVWMSRSVSWRTKTNPYGDVNNPNNQKATKLNMAISILARIAYAWGVLWLTEQPLSSTFFFTDEQKDAIAICDAKDISMNLDVFETPLDKANHVNWHNTMKDKLNKISMDLKKKVDKSNDPLKKTMKDKNKTKITQTLAQG